MHLRVQEAARGCTPLREYGAVSFTCFTSRRTASRLWENPSCRIFSFDLARCSGVLPARSKASTLAPARCTSRDSKVRHQDLLSLGSFNGAGREQAVTVIEEMLPPRSSVVMTGTWFVQAAGEGKHRTHNSEVQTKMSCCSSTELAASLRASLPGERGTA